MKRAEPYGSVATLLVAVGCALGSLPAAAAIVYDNTGTATNVWSFNGALDVNGVTFTNLNINQLTLAAGSSGEAVDAITFLAYQGSTAVLTAAATIDIWASNTAGTGPGALLGSYDVGSQDFLPNVETPLTVSIPLGALLVPGDDTLWAGIYFDTPTASASASGLGSLGARSYHPATIGTDGQTAYFVGPTTPLGFSVDNPITNAFGGAYGANYGWVVDAAPLVQSPVPEPASAWLLLSGLAGLGLLARYRRTFRAA